MTPPDCDEPGPARRGAPGREWLSLSALVVSLIALLISTSVPAQPHGPTAAPAQAEPAIRQDASPKLARTSPTEVGVHWQELTPLQKEFLLPLEHDWVRLDGQQKRKWLELSARSPKMPADERQRIQARMTEWAKLTPEQRGQARLRYQAAKQLPLRDRQARWDAYQSLSPEQKKQFAARASLAASSPEAGRKMAAAPAARTERALRDPQAKSNIVPNPELAAPPRQIAPTLVQARPGATTTLISRPAAPPPHQQTGMPKIAATPEFVNKSTLLPKRGPQGAATRSAAIAPAASSSEATLRQ